MELLKTRKIIIGIEKEENLLQCILRSTNFN
jgi:hypothetical protein